MQHVPDAAIGSVLVSWYQKNKRALPWRQRFLESGDPYVIWISEIMLQQTTIQAVLPAYERFLGIFPRLHDLAAASEEAVRLACRGLGYYRRFRLMHEAAQVLAAREPFHWPRTFKDWRELPGIGDYTAAAISSIAFGEAKAVVDGNVERVFCRLLDRRVVPDQKLKREFQAMGDLLIPAAAPADYNQAVMELGQTICIKQNPRCEICPIQNFCKAYAAGSQNLAPAPRKPMEYEDVKMHLWLLIKGGKVGLVERSKGARFLGGTLGLPTALEHDGQLRWEQDGPWNFEPDSVGSFKHSITRHKIQAFVHQREWLGASSRDITWVPLHEAESQLVSNLDRKALHLFLKISDRHP
ncbi:A/G-specific adenine glycosylase [Oligoflexus tunisiensis]|uniref:A/G-specific adenine glycosylase n=1 Tax=Oligoflexus tunisiensis TaxID=708132 RepID=UPI000A4FDE80|nr:A/G-specific adenine glycosylase [Oligoflexus tunisiensis]